MIRYDDTLHQLAVDGELKLKSEIANRELQNDLDVKDTALTFKNLLIKDGKVSFEGALTAKEFKLSPELALKDLAFNLKIADDVVTSVSAQSTIDFLKAKILDLTFWHRRAAAAARAQQAGDGGKRHPQVHRPRLLSRKDRRLGRSSGAGAARVARPSHGLQRHARPQLVRGRSFRRRCRPFSAARHSKAARKNIDVTGTYDMGDVLTGSATGTIIAPEFATIVGQARYDVNKQTSTLTGTFNYFDGTITGNATTDHQRQGARPSSGSVTLNIPNIALFGPGAGPEPAERQPFPHHLARRRSQ